MNVPTIGKRGVTNVVITLSVCAAAAVEATPLTTGPANPPVASRVVIYAPGVSIDWSRSIVELDGVVAMRRGPLELFACVRGTREHESVVAVRARPLRVFEAMGLIGLTPGEPVRVDPLSGRVTPPVGQPLRIDVVIRTADGERSWGIHQWMRRTGGGPLERCDWVFAGSRRMDGGSFLADRDGTVICLVDFESALIAPPQNHSASDAALWLEADPEHVSPIGTDCVIRISAAVRGRTVVHVDSTGAILVDSEPVTVDQVVARVRAELARDSGSHVLVAADSPDGSEQAAALRSRLAEQGIEAIVRPACTCATQPTSRPAERAR